MHRNTAQQNFDRQLPTGGIDISDTLISQRAADLMQDGQEFAPLEISNLAEVLGDLSCHQTKNPDSALVKLHAAVRANDAESVLALLKATATAYWLPYAENQAETDLKADAETACDHCGGSGCRHCEEEF